MVIFVCSKAIMRRILFLFFLVFLGIQVIRMDYDLPESLPENDLIALTNPTVEVVNIHSKSCYNCHSYTTNFTWYSQLAPLSWVIMNNVIEARRLFNFSKKN